MIQSASGTAPNREFRKAPIASSEEEEEGRKGMKGREVNQTRVRFASLHWGKGKEQLGLVM